MLKLKPVFPTGGVALASPLLVAMALLGAHDAAAQTKVNRVVNADPKGRVDVTNVTGRVSVKGWDKPQIAIDARLGRGVERLDVQSSAGRTTIKVILPKGVSARDGDAQLDIRVPRASALAMSTVSADQAVGAVAGGLELRAISGDIDAATSGEFADVKSVSGNIRLTLEGGRGKVRVSTVSGDIVATGSELELQSVNGDLTLSGPALASIRAQTTSGDVDIGGVWASSGALEYQSVSGDLRVRARSENGVTAELSSFSGDISNCYGVKAVRTSAYSPGSKLETTIGKGAVRLRAKTMSGDIALCDR